MEIRPWSMVGVSKAVTAGGVAVALPTGASATQMNARVGNPNDVVGRVAFGASDVIANATDSAFVLPGTERIFILPPNTTHVHCVGASLLVEVGNGF